MGNRRDCYIVECRVFKARVTLDDKQESDYQLPYVLSQYICTYQHKFIRKGLKQKVTFFPLITGSNGKEWLEGDQSKMGRQQAALVMKKESELGLSLMERQF